MMCAEPARCGQLLQPKSRAGRGKANRKSSPRRASWCKWLPFGRAAGRSCNRAEPRSTPNSEGFREQALSGLTRELRRLSRAGAFGARASFALRVRRAMEAVCRRETRARLPPFPRAFGFSWRRELHAIRAGFECCALPKAFVPPEKSA